MGISQVVQIDANVQWKVGRGQSGDYIAVCDPLRLTLQASSLDHLAEDITLALDALLKDLLEANELNQFLRDQGWVLIGPIPKRPEEVSFEVPFFLAMKGNGTANRVHQ